MAAYRPGQGLNKEALARLRARKQESEGIVGLPAEDKSKQWDALLGTSAKKIPRCGVCTKPADGDDLLCSACRVAQEEYAKQQALKKSVEQVTWMSGSKAVDNTLASGCGPTATVETVAAKSGSTTPSTVATPRDDTESRTDASASVPFPSLDGPEDENRALKEQNAALLRQLNEKAALLQQKAMLEEEHMRLQMVGSLGAIPDPSFHWNMRLAQALQQQQALLGFNLSQCSMTALEGSVKTGGRSRGNTASTTCSFESGGRSRFQTGCSFDEGEFKTGSVARTTVMMRNIPNDYTRKQLLDLIDKQGFATCYDLAYIPVDFKKWVGLGYGFINFVSTEEAERFMQHFNGFSKWSIRSSKRCEVSWSDALQGLEENVERYRNLHVMHPSVPDDFKPALFNNGKRIPFPLPTRKIRAPDAVNDPQPVQTCH